MPSIRGRGRVRVSLDTLANDYPPDCKLTVKVQLFELRHLFQRWRERLGTSSVNLVIWPMHVGERWGMDGECAPEKEVRMEGADTRLRNLTLDVQA